MSNDLPESPVSEDVVADGEFIDDGVLYDEEVAPQEGILGFTLRELLIVGVWLIHFVVSFFPIVANSTLWSTGIEWVLPVGVPTAAVFLIVLRRFSPDGIRRVGSLGIDQFASVAFTVAAVFILGKAWLGVSAFVGSGLWVLGWSAPILVITSLALVALTVFAPIIPRVQDDFQGRLVTLAHRAANPVRPVIARPRPEPAAVTESDEPKAVTSAPLDVELSGENATDEIARFDLASQVPLTAHASGGGTGADQPLADEDYTPSYARSSNAADADDHAETTDAAGSDAQEDADDDLIAYDTASILALVNPPSDEADDADETDTIEPIDAPEPVPAPAAVADEIDVDATNPREVVAEQQPFWILAPTERDIDDERGNTIFQIGPNAWALVVEDRGGAFVVRHDDGRIGYLHDISDITRG